MIPIAHRNAALRKRNAERILKMVGGDEGLASKLVSGRENDRVATVFLLGRTGDQCIALPCLKRLAEQNGGTINVITAAKYASLFTGTSYVRPIVFNGQFSKVGEALAKFSRAYPGTAILQPYASDHQLPKSTTGSFCEEIWKKAGMLELFNRLPLVFDRRNAKRELELVESLGLHRERRHIVLLASSGVSSPFQHKELLRQTVESIPNARVVDISNVRAVQFYDLLALYDLASAIVCTDSAPLHLSRATPTLPVIAFLADKPSLWHGSRTHHAKLEIRYSEAPARMDEVRSVLEAITRPRLIHLTQDWTPEDPKSAARESQARATWEQFYTSGEIVKEVFNPGDYRTALDFGEAKVNSPMIVDVVDDFTKRHPRDVIVFSNSDIAAFPCVPDAIRENVNLYGCFYSARIDLEKLPEPLVPENIPTGNTIYSGADLFAFTSEWWNQHRERIPDILMAFEGSDFVLKALMRESGFIPGSPCIAHVTHEDSSNWKFNNKRPGQIHNRAACKAWAEENGYAHYLLPNGDYLFSEL